MQQAVIFDMDGVLIDSYQAHFESWRLLGESAGYGVTEAQFAASFGRTSREIIADWWADSWDAAKQGGPLDADRVAAMDARKEAFYRELIEADFPAMAGVAELLHGLHQAGLAMAVGSSGPPENVAVVRRQLGDANHFAAAVTGADVTCGKPDPQVFLIAAQKLGVAPGDCAVVEDAPPGVQAAVAAGMTPIAITGTAPRSALAEAGARLVVDSLTELSPSLIRDLIATAQSQSQSQPA